MTTDSFTATRLIAPAAPPGFTAASASRRFGRARRSDVRGPVGPSLFSRIPIANRGAERRLAAASHAVPARAARGDLTSKRRMFSQILIANRGAERRLAAASLRVPARAAHGDLTAERPMFSKILIANRGAERRLAAASLMLPARAARGDLTAE